MQGRPLLPRLRAFIVTEGLIEHVINECPGQPADPQG